MTDKNEMPIKIFAWMGMQDNGSWDRIEGIQETTQYTRTDYMQAQLDEVIKCLEYCKLRIRNLSSYASNKDWEHDNTISFPKIQKQLTKLKEMRGEV